MKVKNLINIAIRPENMTNLFENELLSLFTHSYVGESCITMTIVNHPNLNSSNMFVYLNLKGNVAFH